MKLSINQSSWPSLLWCLMWSICISLIWVSFSALLHYCCMWNKTVVISPPCACSWEHCAVAWMSHVFEHMVPILTLFLKAVEPLGDGLAGRNWSLGGGLKFYSTSPLFRSLTSDFKPHVIGASNFCCFAFFFIIDCQTVCDMNLCCMKLL